MYLMYVDESGDIGTVNSPTRYFVLTGLVVHELKWQDYLDQLIDFRRRMRSSFGLRLRDEIHASVMINRPGELIRIPRHERLAILRMFADELAGMTEISLINVVVDKQNKGATYDVFDNAWKALLQRFENTLSHQNFPGLCNPDERGMILPDHTDDKKLTEVLRQMRRYNPAPNQRGYAQGYQNMRVNRIVEDPSFRDSAHSYFIQACDMAAYLLYQHLAPNAFMHSKSANNYFDRMSPILCLKASSTDPRGIVRL